MHRSPGTSARSVAAFLGAMLVCFVAAWAPAQAPAQTRSLRAAPADRALFVERPGITEFSGQMIVRPLQPEALAAQLRLSLAGRDGDTDVTAAVAATRARAVERIAPHVIEYVRQTDEYIVDLPEWADENSFADALMATGEYEYAVPNWICFPTATVPNDGGYWQQWHHAKVRSALAWDIETGGADTVIAIVDGGININHIDMAAAVVPGYNAPNRLPQLQGGAIDDVDGHGTYVAGIAGAIGNNGTHVVGMGWGFSIMPVRYYNSPGGGFLSDLLDGVRWAVDNGADIVNVSQTGVEFAPVQTTGQYVSEQGGLLVWAAGNDGRYLGWFDWPDVLIVGATDQNDGRPTWSAYGVAVDAFAPGVDMLSIGREGGLAIGSGTSAATPVVTGIAGLLKSAHPGATPKQIERWIMAGCVDLGSPGDDALWGNGRVDAFSSMRAPKHIAPLQDASGPG